MTVAKIALRVPTTHRAWIVRYRVDGRSRRFTLGDLRHLTLAEARKKASDAKRTAPMGSIRRLRKRRGAKPERLRASTRKSEGGQGSRKEVLERR
jgi:hypothetical protein